MYNSKGALLYAFKGFYYPSLPPSLPPHPFSRMREQVKSRMETLLRLEIQARQRQKLQRGTHSTAQTTSGLASTTSTSSTTGLTSSQTRQASSSKGGGEKEEAKADMVYHVDAGEEENN